MIIKCPNCETGYNIPDEVVGDKPRRMRCTKCKTMFTVARHSAQPPVGYVEYTSDHSLPPEFAFLREAAPPATPAPAPAPAQDADPVEEAFQEFAPIPNGAPQVPQQAPPPAAQAPQAFQQAPPPAAQAPQVPQQTPPAAAQAAPPRSSVDMFGGGARPSWEDEAPLDLGEYTLHHGIAPQATGNQRAGKVVFAVLLLVMIFLIFVTWRNDWNLSPLDLPDQVAFAFSGEAKESLPKAVKNIEAFVLKSAVVVDAQNKSLLSVTGDVYNNNPTARAHILLRGRLRDTAGKVRAETRLPCGRAYDNLALRNRKTASVRDLFLVDGVLYDCQISAQSSTLFQLVFDDLPDDYQPSFSVEVVPVAAVAK
ncbi:MAG: hypothetical protein GX146_11640 [Myxococcales bacterium]|nr:hypothetical protein [Myxococcales bacterium]